jgi:hypothetical protein
MISLLTEFRLSVLGATHQSMRKHACAGSSCSRKNIGRPGCGHSPSNRSREFCATWGMTRRLARFWRNGRGSEFVMALGRPGVAWAGVVLRPSCVFSLGPSPPLARCVRTRASWRPDAARAPARCARLLAAPRVKFVPISCEIVLFSFALVSFTFALVSPTFTLVSFSFALLFFLCFQAVTGRHPLI